MSSANAVPETWQLEGDSAWRLLVDEGRWRLFVEAAVRLRVADGFSHARSLAFIAALIAVQGVVGLVGLASALGEDGVGDTARQVVGLTAPGAVGSTLTTTIDQARLTGEADRFVAIGFGLLGALVTGTTGMGQLQRSLNRLYGIEQDRPTVAKYRQAFVLAVSAGTLIVVAFGSIAFGDVVVEDNTLTPVWAVVRVPVAVVLMVGAVSVMFRWCPDRRQPGWRWLAVGAAVSVSLWVAATLLLRRFFNWSGSFGDAYGPLAGIVALLLWALLSSIALLYGAAIAAQLEAVRAAYRVPDREPLPRGPTDVPAVGVTAPVRKRR